MLVMGVCLNVHFSLINVCISVKNKDISPMHTFFKFLMALATIGIVYTHSPRWCVLPGFLHIRICKILEKILSFSPKYWENLSKK